MQRFTATCPGCRRTVHAPESLIGRKARCRCDAVFTVEDDGIRPVPAPRPTRDRALIGAAALGLALAGTMAFADLRSAVSGPEQTTLASAERPSDPPEEHRSLADDEDIPPVGMGGMALSTLPEDRAPNHGRGPGEATPEAEPVDHAGPPDAPEADPETDPESRPRPRDGEYRTYAEAREASGGALARLGFGAREPRPRDIEEYLRGCDLGIMFVRLPPETHTGRSCPRTLTIAPSYTSGTARSTPPPPPAPSTSSPSRRAAA